MRFVRKLRGLIGEFGLQDALLYVVGLGIGRVCPRVRLFRYHLVAQSVPATDFLPPRRGRAIEVRRLEAGDPAFDDLPLDRAVLDFRFRQDVICLGAFSDGDIVGCLWLAFGQFEEDEVRCVFALDPPDSLAWDFDVYVRPDARVGFAFLRLWDAANALLRSRGIAWSVSRISGFNPGSMASHARLGATPIGGLVALQGPRRQAVFSSLKPFFSLIRLDCPLPRYVVSVPEERSAR